MESTVANMGPKIYVMTNNKTREEWLEHRRSGIGGSDAAAILGMNERKSAMEVYLEKIGEKPPEELDNEYIYWGNILEPIVASEFTRRAGIKVRRRNAILQHSDPDLAFLHATIDRDCVGIPEGMECKTGHEFTKDGWEDEDVPDAYYIQCAHYMAVTGYRAWWIAALIGGNKFIFKKIERDEELIQELIRKEYEFWHNHVLAKNPPPLDGSQGSSDILKKMFPESRPFCQIHLPAEADALVKQYDEASEEVKAANKRKDEAKHKLEYMMGEAEEAKVGDRPITWKAGKNTFDSKAFQEDHPELYEQYRTKKASRRFNLKKAPKPKKKKKQKASQSALKEAK